jgi:cytochrome P450
VIAKLQAEVDTVMGGRVPQFEDVIKLEYTRKVFLELMRLYTIAPMLPRRTKEGDMLGDFNLPPKSFVLMFFHGVHHNPRLWEEPERFDPERFSPERVSQRHPFAYAPFSGGPRKCAGDEFALLEGPLAIAMILQRYTVELLPGQNFSARMSVTMRPGSGVKAKIKARTQPIAL